MIIYLIHSRWRDCTDFEMGGVRWRTESPSGYLHKVIGSVFYDDIGNILLALDSRSV